MSCTVGSVHVELAQVIAPATSNVSPARQTGSIVSEYGGPHMERMLEGDDADDDEVTAVRS